MTQHATREDWLNACASEIARHARATNPEGRAGLNEETPFRVSCGFAPSLGRRKANQSGVIPPVASEDDTAEVFVAPTIADSAEVISALIPLMACVISDDYKNGSRYRKVLNRLNGFAPRLSVLGDYPHAEVTLPTLRKQSTRLIKVACNPCGYIARVSNTTLSTHGAPICPSCLNAMTKENN